MVDLFRSTEDTELAGAELAFRLWCCVNAGDSFMSTWNLSPLPLKQDLLMVDAVGGGQ